MKKLIISIFIATTIVAPVMASNYKILENSTSNIYAWDDSRYEKLSTEEMKSTEGQFLPLLPHIAGVVGGAYAGGTGYLAGGGKDPFAFVTSVAAGAGGGLISPINGIRNGLVTVTGGLISGAIGAWMTNNYPNND